MKEDKTVGQTKDKTTVSFHQEKLTESTQRKEMKQHWDAVIKKLQNKFTDR